MCTVSWIHESDGYHLFFSRDEKLTRKPALEPRPIVRDGIHCLAPIDGDYGGTWIGTNEFGVSVCLLNGYNKLGARPELRSRGLLVMEAISLPSIAGLVAHVGHQDLAVYATFTLAALEPGKPAVVIEWNGSRKSVIHHPDRHLMLTSSSFDSGRVGQSRHEVYESLTHSSESITPELLHGFHEWHGKEPNAYSVCMHRPDAETVSFSRICVSPSGSQFFYTPAALCKKAPGVSLKLARSLSSGSN